MLARAAAARFPDKATRAYDELLRTAADASDWGALAQEAVEYAIFGCRDFALAERAIGRVQAKLPKDSRRLAALRLDLALQQGKEPEARTWRDELIGGRDLAQKQRYAAVKGNALRERFYDLLRAEFIFEARETLWNWMDLAPSDRLDGSLPLARARLFKTLAWLDGALGELDGAILLDPLLPNLPDVELDRGRILNAAGNAQKARDVFARIVKEFPNHPAAAEAKEAMK
jgi:tetratricopeptide (TPR) repeat protein